MKQQKPKWKRRESPRAVAAALSTTPQCLATWRRAGCPHTMSKTGAYLMDSGEVAAWLVANPKFGGPRGGTKGEGSAKLEAQKIRQVTALADRYEMQNARLAGELVFVSEVDAAAGEVAGLVRNRFMQLPAAVAPGLVGLSAEDIEVILEARIVEILALLSRPILFDRPANAPLRPSSENAAERMGGDVPDTDAADSGERPLAE